MVRVTESDDAEALCFFFLFFFKRCSIFLVRLSCNLRIISDSQNTTKWATKKGSLASTLMLTAPTSAIFTMCIRSKKSQPIGISWVDMGLSLFSEVPSLQYEEKI
eukprot:TRINITY_DN33906_c0_g1_i1.p1 TRINITY_DN33906_c0_g1~~TRINITY_DN33906_c0_g1_i1.p1  ORF type:complete len:112 (+),score=0.06 TRINITY_DN33906_c0_g1_i1:22-336(+)